MEKKVIELFAGVGGFRVGLNAVKGFNANGKAIENRNWDFVWANQWEPSTKNQYAFDCYQTRFGHSERHSNQDINTVDKQSIPDHSLLVGGFPCQDYSVARGTSGEKGIQGKKGVLFWDIASILEAKHSPFILLENVDRLLKSPAFQRGRDFGIMLRTLHDLGYNVEWRVINAAEYGFPQKRRRVFIFAWKKESHYQQTLNACEGDASNHLIHDGFFASIFPVLPEISSRTIDILKMEDTVAMTESFSANFGKAGIMIDGIVTTGDVEPILETPITLREVRQTTGDHEQYYLTPKQEEKFKYLKGSKQIARVKPNGESYFYSEGGMSYPDNLDSPGRTMLTSEASVNRSTHIIEDAATGRIRYLTPVEAERLQCFPDDWTNTGMPLKKRYFMMGNALVTGLIDRMEPKLEAIIDKE